MGDILGGIYYGDGVAAILTFKRFNTLCWGYDVKVTRCSILIIVFEHSYVKLGYCFV